jgi:hypothetical protein
MKDKLSKVALTEVIEALRKRYQPASKKEKTRILKEFVALSGYHRKHAIRLLSNMNHGFSTKPDFGRRVYDEAVLEALTILWEAADRICSKRLKAILPDLMDAMMAHGHLSFDPEVYQRLLSVSPATIDRLLKPVHEKARVRKKHRAKSKMNKKIPVRTFNDWEGPPPGYFEIDFVMHCGNSMSGSIISTLAATDVCTGWIEGVPLLAREQSLVVEGLEVIRNQLPFPLLGIDSDNDSAFINEKLLEYSKSHGIEFTRSRAYKKNDQAWIEQKNGAVIRRFVGHGRLSGIVAGQTLAHMYHAIRFYVNYFQPSFKLKEKSWQGSTVNKTYHKPATPCERLLEHPAISNDIKEKLKKQRKRLDPLALLNQIRNDQAALASLVSPEDYAKGLEQRSLEQFLLQLPRLWRAGEVRPTHRKTTDIPRYWRTRKDPFESVWTDVLQWLQAEPDITAKSMFQRLQRAHPGQFADGQLRTLQRRVKDWRHIMAKQLVYACLADDSEVHELKPVSR